MLPVRADGIGLWQGVMLHRSSVCAQQCHSRKFSTGLSLLVCWLQVIKSFPEMEAELDRQSNEKERHLTTIVPKRDTKLKRMYANPSKDKVIAATIIQVRARLGHACAMVTCGVWCVLSRLACLSVCPSVGLLARWVILLLSCLLVAQMAFRFAMLRRSRANEGISALSLAQMSSFKFLLGVFSSNLRKLQISKVGWNGSLMSFNKATELQVHATVNGCLIIRCFFSVPLPATRSSLTLQIQLLKTNIQCIATEWEETLSSQREALQVAEQSVVDLRTTLTSILESIPDRIRQR